MVEEVEAEEVPAACWPCGHTWALCTTMTLGLVPWCRGRMPRVGLWRCWLSRGDTLGVRLMVRTSPPGWEEEDAVITFTTRAWLPVVMETVETRGPRLREPEEEADGPAQPGPAFDTSFVLDMGSWP